MSHGFGCKCGQVRGRIDATKASDFDVLACRCKFCRAIIEIDEDAARYKIEGDFVHIAHLKPWQVHIESGQAHLAYMRLSKNGPRRWYASCCNTAMFNSLERSFPPFLAILNASLDAPEALAPVSYFAFSGELEKSKRPKPSNMAAMIRLGMRFIWRVIGSLMTGNHKRNPLFDDAFKAPDRDQTPNKAERAKLFKAAQENLG